MPAGDRQVTLELARGGDSGALGELLETFRPCLRVLVQPFCDERLRARLIRRGVGGARHRNSHQTDARP